MSGWIKLNFGDSQWASFNNRCLEVPIKGYVPRPGIKPQLEWTLSVSNGAMTVRPLTGLFFTPFHCGSSTKLSGPVRLTFALVAPRKFGQLHVKIAGSVGLDGEEVRARVGSGPFVPLPEAPMQPGTIRYGRNFTLSPAQSVFEIESTAAEMNLVELWWVYQSPGRLDLPG